MCVARSASRRARPSRHAASCATDGGEWEADDNAEDDDDAEDDEDAKGDEVDKDSDDENANEDGAEPTGGVHNEANRRPLAAVGACVGA